MLVTLCLQLMACAAQNSDPMPWPSSAATTAVSSNAPAYVAYGSRASLPTISVAEPDFHPVHGVPAGDGSAAVIFCGKMVDTGGQNDGFVTKFDISGFSGGSSLDMPDSAVVWSGSWGSAGQRDCCNAAASSSVAAFAGGMKNEQRYLAKYNLASGAAEWSVSLPDGTASAIEYISLTPSGGLICAGVGQGTANSMEAFKSYGNPVAGRAFLMYFSPDKVSASSAPSSPTWDKSYGNTYLRALTVQALSDGNFIALLMKTEGAPKGQKTALLKVNAQGDQVWLKDYTEFGEPTDMQILSDGYILVVGIDHSSGVSGTGTDGAVMKVSSDGNTVVWKKVYGDPTGGVGKYSGVKAPNPLLIYEECWGATPTSDGGAVVGCGTGIEGCNPHSGALRTECDADPRTTWRSMLFKINGAGEVVWSRLDNWASEQSGNDVGASASEYDFHMNDGKIVSVNDEGRGIGVLVLQPQSSPSPTPSPSSSPAPSPTPSPSPVPPTPSPSSSPTPSPSSPAVSGGSKIMVIGDSNAQYSGTTLQTHCAGSTVVNKGVSGSTAATWNADTAECGQDQNCQFSTAFSGSGWTHVWLSLGANDLMDASCSLSKAQVKSRLETSITKIRQSVPSISIVFTSYCISAAEETCSIAAFLASVAGAMEEIAAADSAVTFWNMAEVCGGTISPESQGNAQYFVSDGIHLNEKGYAKLWANSALQAAFGCGTSPSPSPSPSSLPPSPSPSPSANATVDWSTQLQFGLCTLMAITLHRLIL